MVFIVCLNLWLFILFLKVLQNSVNNIIKPCKHKLKTLSRFMKKEIIKIIKIIMLPFTPATFTTKFSQTIKKKPKLYYCITYPIVFE